MRFSPVEVSPMTNGDYIRSLTDEELVWWIDSHCPEDVYCKVGEKSCEDCWLEWLRMPREEDT